MVLPGHQVRILKLRLYMTHQMKFQQCTAHGLMGHKFKIVSNCSSDISANDASFNNIEILTDIIVMLVLMTLKLIQLKLLH